MSRESTDIRTRRRLAWPLALAGLAIACTIAGADPLNPPELRRAFVTSSTHTGNLGGLAGADAICQQRATEALLPNPTGFVAFLSDSLSDAYCRVHGLTGKRATNCGLPTLPTYAGPWVRTDGFPFAARIDEALEPTGRVLAPLLLDENGQVPSVTTPAWTNSDGLGANHSTYPTPCSDWGAESGSAGSGSFRATTGSWLHSGAAACTVPSRLYCLETGLATPLPAYRSGGALAFVTSTTQSGALGGLAGGDALCVARATSAGLPAPGSFVAWLSAGMDDAIDRLTYDGPWIRLDGVRIATGRADLTDETLFAPVNQTETGQYIGNWVVATGTLANGTGSGSDCLGWISPDAGQIAHYGIANRTTYQWTQFTTAPCNSSFRLYCFSNFPAIVFVDDFESSDSLAWSATVTP